MKKKKMWFSDMEKMGIFYHDFRCNFRNKKGEKGTLFILDTTLTDNQKEEILKWKNTELYFSSCQYAPEIRHNALFIADKCIR